MIQLPPTVTTPEDLLAEFERTGDTAPFEEIVRRYSGMVYGVCYRVTRNAHDAEDATQATFLKLATHARVGFVSPKTGVGSGLPRVGPWLQQVAKTTAVDLRRSKSRRHNREQIRAAIQEQEQPVSDATDDASMDELKQVLRDEVDRLPVHYRTPLILYYFGGMSTEQIAVELKTNAKALAVRLFRARKMLGARLTARGVAAASGMVGCLAVADAILAALAGTVFKAGGTGSMYASAGAGSGLFAGWTTSHSAICATLAGRINSTMRAATVGVVASKWKMSLVMLLTVGTTMAGTSEVVQQAPVMRDLGRWMEQIGEALRELGAIGQQLRGGTPKLQAANDQEPSAPAQPPQQAIVPVSPMKIDPPVWPVQPPAGVPLPQPSRSPVAASTGWSAGLGSNGLRSPNEPRPLSYPPPLAGTMDGSAGGMLLAMNERANRPSSVGGDRAGTSAKGEAFVGPVAMADAAPEFGPMLTGGTSGDRAEGAAGEIATAPDVTPIDITGGASPGNVLIASGRQTEGEFLQPGSVSTPDLSTNQKGLDFIDPAVLTPPAIQPPATQPIPEPAAVGLLALGAIGLLARRRRR